VFSVWSERAVEQYQELRFGEFVGWVRYLLQHWKEFVPKRLDSYGYVAIDKF